MKRTNEDKSKINNLRSRQSNLRQLIADKKKQKEQICSEEPVNITPDPYDILYSYLNEYRKSTAVGTETDVMTEHKNEWEDNHPENPERLKQIINRVAELCLLSRCKVLPFYNDCSEIDVSLNHTNSLINKLKEISKIQNINGLEQAATEFDGVYFNKDTFKAAMRALTWTLTVTDEVCKGNSHNGFAIVRPPGHHAKHNAFEGYCYFNNVAIAAEKCLKQNICKKILIIDYDVHHGNGTQDTFYKRDNVLYFSIHRYEHGLFWPNLRESNFDYIGEGVGKGYNVNVPLNHTGLKDSDYLAIVFHLLLPMAYEFQPDLIFISAGYDAAVGCPEGQMFLTPGFYSHLIHLLSGLANGKIVMVLEGGYFIPSLSESAAMSLKALLNDPCPILDDISTIHSTVIDSINNCIGVLHNHWKCFSGVQLFDYNEDHKENIHDEHIISVKYFGEVEKPPHITRSYFPVLSKLAINDFTSFINRYQNNEENYKTYKGTGYGYEPDVLLHSPDRNSHSFEVPERLSKILDFMKSSGLTESCVEIKVPSNISVLEHCLNVHDESHMNLLMSNMMTPVKDLYFNQFTSTAITKSVSVILTLVDSVMKNEVTNAVALIRPPGHHASFSKPQGFCFVNNIAVAAKYAKSKYNLEKILIVDFDVHHGNGTQDIFYSSNNVLYISIHRFDKGNFYPNKPTAGANYVGHGPGEGFNVNIPFSGDIMGNTEYMAAFLKIILPISYAFKPELVLVSAGFDAGINDPLGGYTVTPEMFGQFIYLLKPLAGGKMILALEGGYNVSTTAYSMIMCIKALKGDSIPVPSNIFSKNINKNAVETIKEVIGIQKKYWSCLNVTKMISNKILHHRYEKTFTEKIYDKNDYIDKQEG